MLLRKHLLKCLIPAFFAHLEESLGMKASKEGSCLSTAHQYGHEPQSNNILLSSYSPVPSSVLKHFLPPLFYPNFEVNCTGQDTLRVSTWQCCARRDQQNSRTNQALPPQSKEDNLEQYAS